MLKRTLAENIMRSKPIGRSNATCRECGIAIVEFAIVAILYLFVVLSIIELGLLFFMNLTMQHAVREGARYAVTGQVSLDPNASNQQRYLAIIQAMKSSSMGFFDRVLVDVVVTINNGTPITYGKPSNYVSGMFGGPGDIIVLRLDCSWPLMNPLWQSAFTGGKYVFSVAATMRNEAYS